MLTRLWSQNGIQLAAAGIGTFLVCLKWDLIRILSCCAAKSSCYTQVWCILPLPLMLSFVTGIFRWQNHQQTCCEHQEHDLFTSHIVLQELSI